MESAEIRETKTCLLILGMHRSGTSALTRVLNLLGYGLPERLIGALEGNEAGHWEPENVVLFNDRLLAAMQSSWHDFRALPASRLSPAERVAAGQQLAELLARDYGDQPHIVLKDPRICRFAPLYLEALEGLGYRVVPIIAFRNPAEVIRSLQKRRVNWPEGLGASQAALLWLRHVLDAEQATRGRARVFCDYDTLMKDWQSELPRLAGQGGFAFPEPIRDSAPIVEEFLSPHLRHEDDRARDNSGQPALRGWVHRAHDALQRLAVNSDSDTAQAALDQINAAFNAAELPLSDLSEGSAKEIRATAAERRALSEENQKQRQMLETGAQRITALEQRREGQDQQIAELNAALDQTRKQARTQDQAHIRALEDAAAAHRAELDEIQTAHRAEQARMRWQAGKIDELNALFHDRNMQIDGLRLTLEQQRDEFLASRSWRITAPLRGVTGRLRALRRAGQFFRRASATKGGLLAGAGAAAGILFREGPSGLRRRMAVTQNGAEGGALPAHADPQACFIAATPHVTSLARLMQKVLAEEGYRVTLATDLAGAERAGHVFVICPQMFATLPDHYIAVQMEQSVSPRWFTADYFARLKRARAVIDYSLRNISFLHQNGLPLERLHYVPLDADPRLPAPPETPRQGILFYGDDKCPRRQKILSAVAAAYPQLKIVSNLFGAALEDELRRAAVVLNVHYYEGALLETTRIYQALSHGTPVVSEESADQDEHRALDGVVDFAPIGDVDRIIELLRPYAQDSAAATQKRQRVVAFAGRADNRFEMFFRRFLLAQNMIGYDAFTARAPAYPRALGAAHNYCLSLPETPERRALFAAQGRGEFALWNGLKASPGWVGAATSYRHMFERLTAAGAERAVVCEDDVLFPEDYETRLEIVERYLEGHQWDVFSGFIADAHDDLEIVAVDSFEGQTFVHIDRTVSMVFNIYNRDIMAFLAQWDPANRDVHANTIDRYLESHGNTRVIVALPFLVRHRPDATSTIWGFENSQYDEVVEKSENLLARKVAQFRKNQAEDRAADSDLAAS